ncbi:hypothetical protein [Macrococcus brunensis]|uniref:hypothetical protein n=1 Tax=Macrococcus brunensis TaxID=198483 RepID=UPI001EF0011C|nr:hypothetical protein [Macrococcus brunensis]ULG72230.1 hypothetical protein MGG12_01505 [Macrococcus brunensis]ULG74489.1 hypothetical protein MGG13_01570 [Macrococcus brunensis]
MIILKIFIFIYGLLTIIATVSDFNHNGFNWLHSLYLSASLLLMYTAFTANNLILLVIGLVGLMIAAFLTGLFSHDFHWSHHIIRLIVSASVVALFIYLRK